MASSWDNLFLIWEFCIRKSTSNSHMIIWCNVLKYEMKHTIKLYRIKYFEWINKSILNSRKKDQRFKKEIFFLFLNFLHLKLRFENMLVYSINVFVMQSSISFLYYELHVRNNFELQTHVMCYYYYYLTAEQCHMISCFISHLLWIFLMPFDNYQRVLCKQYNFLKTN